MRKLDLSRYYHRIKNPPTAHIVPDIRIAHLLMRGYEPNKKNVNHKSFVIGGSKEIAKYFALDDVPAIHYNTSLMVEMLLNRLRELKIRPQPQPTVLTLPLQTRFPE